MEITLTAKVCSKIVRSRSKSKKNKRQQTSYLTLFIGPIGHFEGALSRLIDTYINTE